MAKKQKTSSNLLEVQNAAKTMFANIRFQSIDSPIKSILLTSSVPDEGKTTTAWYLAQAMATAGNRVLMVEADMRRRSMANMLQLHPRNGLFSVLSGSVQLKDAVVPTSVKNLFFLDAEPSIPNPPDLLASKRMARFNETLCTEYDYVLYDTPPVGTFVDAAVLGTVVDGVILVVRPGKPKRTELQMAHSQLVNADANVIGLCSTFVEGTGSEYYYSYYTKGGRSRKDDGKEMSLHVNGEDTAGANAPFAALPSEAAQQGAGNRAAGAAASRGSGAHSGQARGAAGRSTGASYATTSMSSPREGISVPRSTPNRGQAARTVIAASKGSSAKGSSAKGSSSNETAEIRRK